VPGASPHPEEARSAVSKGGPRDGMKPNPQIQFSNSQLFVVAIENEAIRNLLPTTPDCFVASAPRNDDSKTCVSIPAAKPRPSLAANTSLKKTEGAGKAGRERRPQPRMQEQLRIRDSHHRYAATIRPSLRNGFTASFVLSSAIGLSCRRRRRK
jgi:hypothetical protein